MKLIVESGSTKTNWLLLGNNNKPLEYYSKGINPYYESKDEIIFSQKDDLSQLGDIAHKISEIYYYGTGITDDTKAKVVEEVLKFFFKNAIKFEINNDLIAAARALFGHKSGIACIFGTGSNSGLYDGNKISFQVPPLGFWLGDEGSGGHLGKQLILSYLHKEMPETLRTSFEATYGQKDRIEILNHAYKEAFPNRYFASFCPFLSAHISDDYVQNLVLKSFELFFQKYLLKYPNIEETNIGYVGSIAFTFESQLTKVANKYEFDTLKIIKSPINSLGIFHNTTT